ncbi:MAG: bifunctional methylenetetrahydrofolate dehydrogenase/methenyltetrahydrofolate cyclohydrolase FolD [Deltaproteobacteria bacterium]|nr:bifunctional methylenetetrahydrofolate dehydrogenase/methenyltetrahydrofolate cyclohydrolase FolD [Deltaproteobacteria bacterium]
MAKILDGKALSEKLKAQLAQEVKKLQDKSGITPGLAVVIVGEDPASQIYVRGKVRACEKVGIQSFHHALPAETSADLLKHLIEQLNQDPQVHGILVQLPLPGALKDLKVTELINPEKDVDGFHPISLGRLITGEKGFRSCTPFGMMKMLESIDYDLAGKEAVVLGRSNIVGKPMGMMLLEKNATVTYCHSKTKNLEEKIKAADVLVAAVGRPNFVPGDWIKQGAVVLDVGINRLADGKVVGDVDFEGASKRASYITPVPGGVGPMTITMLLWNTVEAAKNKE